MRIQNNISAMNANRNLGLNNNRMDRSLERLSSGFRINRAADDAAGLAISEKMRSQITSLNQSIKNANDGISLIQTAEGAMEEVNAMLVRMKELATQAANGTYIDGDRSNVQREIDQLKQEINKISDTKFNGRDLLNGKGDAALRFQVGNTRADNISVNLTSIDVTVANRMGAASAATKIASGSLKMQSAVVKLASADKKIASADKKFASAELKRASAQGVGVATAEKILASAAGIGASAEKLMASGIGKDGLGGLRGSGVKLKGSADYLRGQAQGTVGSGGGLKLGNVDLGTARGAQEALRAIDDAISTVAGHRATLGAIQNRLEATVRNTGVTVENLTASESRIRDTDMAQEMTQFTKNQILTQAATAMLAQSNMKTQSVLQLLG